LVSDAFSHLTPTHRKKLNGIIFAMEGADEANATAIALITAAEFTVAALPAIDAPTRREIFMLERTRNLIDEYFRIPTSRTNSRPPG
jgi:hypothetical protein